MYVKNQRIAVFTIYKKSHLLTNRVRLTTKSIFSSLSCSSLLQKMTYKLQHDYFGRLCRNPKIALRKCDIESHLFNLLKVCLKIVQSKLFQLF